MLGEDLPLFPCLPQDIFQHSRCTIELDFRTVEIKIYSYLLPSKFFLFFAAGPICNSCFDFTSQGTYPNTQMNYMESIIYNP